MQDIADNLAQVRSRVAAAVANRGGEPAEVRILAVSKQQPASKIREVAALGLYEFGENYLQEALTKQQQLADPGLVWHFIGAIQTNKTRQIAQNFDWVQSVDRFKIAQRLSDQRPDTMSPLNLCLQVNINEEAGKAGVASAAAQELALDISQLPRLKLRGLMAIPRATTDYKEQIQSFLALGNLFDELNAKDLRLDTLSMGMSHDLEAALAAGATMVRIGQALFGPRRVAQ